MNHTTIRFKLVFKATHLYHQIFAQADCHM